MRARTVAALMSDVKARPGRRVPSRSAVCAVQMSFQGLTVNTSAYGTLPWFEPFLASLAASDRQAVYHAKRAAGDTHCGLAVSYRYAEPGSAYQNIPGRDFSLEWPALRDLVIEVIDEGFFVLLHLAGDGNWSQLPNGYNDPVGHTKGWPWLMVNIDQILRELEGLHDWICYCTGFDGVFYGWSPTQGEQFGQRFRALLPDGHLAIEHDIGHLPFGDGGADYQSGGRMSTYDVVLHEFPNWPATGDPVWQIAARALGSAYVRPPDQPSGDDPHPPWYLAPGTARGPYFAIAFEWGAYPWTHGFNLSPNQIAAARAYYRGLGYWYVC